MVPLSGQHLVMDDHAEGEGIDQRVLRDEQLGYDRQVQDVAAVQQHLVDLRELLLGRAHRAGQEHQPQGAVVEQPSQTAKQHVEAGELAQRHQR